MARETFIDTSGFYALLVKRDDMHEAAARVLGNAAKRRARFVTTDYVLDETVTLLCARGHAHLVAPFLESTLKSQACTVDWMNPDRFAQAAAILSKHHDQGYSFTDCVSFATMKARSLRDALTKDDHFNKAGFVALLRSG
jgi:predicted nucleic acid-binding protein